MADAGRILIMPKGTYDASVSYEMLDLVKHNESAWLAKKSVIGIEPSEENSEYWFEMASSDATSLGNETAEEWQGKILNNSEWNELISGFDLNNALGRYRAKSSSIINTLLNIPSGMAIGAEITIEWYPSSKDNSYGMQVLRHHASGASTIYIRTRNGSTWNAWVQLFTTNGGTVHATDMFPVRFSNTSSTKEIYLRFLNNNETKLGDLGFNGVDNPCYVTSTGYAKSLLHTGNKPTGTYTGNGSATSRTVNTGGIGNACLVRNGDYGLLVFAGGAIGKGTDNGDINYGSSQCSFIDGVLKLTTASNAINGNGMTYYYQVL